MYPALITLGIVLFVNLIKGLIRVLGKTDKDPNKDRTFSHPKIQILVGLLTSVVAALIFLIGIINWFSDQPVDPAMIPMSSFTLLIGLFLLAYGLWGRAGIDRDKIWSRFGKIYSREIRFSEVTRLHKGILLYKLYAGKKKVTVDLNSSKVTLIHLRLLEELQHRRFELPNFTIDDPGWEEAARYWRKWLARRLYQDHQMFYDNNPQALAYLNSLTEPPTHYEN
ncbi:hypothetical protein [Arcanobacterium pinnipediorum]|uniref:PH domain-containing protein n=1 Tax=Arcanobacterium pinnipediorum TaxID=1503041 RepID=A0ABY5AHI0_9ACTO|nr:hypothetical protein [Arcanobacterium pinnipediorum]USR79378.1 hypothetical protein NG665_08420 [Arcanobacterium pinnipediorum]